MKSMKITKDIMSTFTLVVIVLVAINFISGVFNLRLDVTSDNQFTLTEGTKTIAGEIKNPLDIKFYFSKSGEDIPVQLKTYAQRVEDIMKEIVATNPSKISLYIVNPKPDTDEELEAQRYGLKPVPMQNGDNLYFGAVFLQGTQEVAIPFFDLQRERHLEYDISESIYRSSLKTKPVLGVMSTLPVMGNPGNPMLGQRPTPGWIAISELKKSFEVKDVDKTTKSIDESISTLIVIHPAGLTKSTQYAIDQFIMRGGKLVTLVDPFSRMALAQGGGNPMAPNAIPFESNLNPLFEKYGFKTGSEVVADKKMALSINFQGQPFPYPGLLNVSEDYIVKDSPMTSTLSEIMFMEAGFIELTDKSSAKMETLLHSSNEALVGNGMSIRMQGPVEFTKKLTGEPKKYTMAALVKGNFKSAFPEGAPKEEPKANPQDPNQPAQPKTEEPLKPHIAETSKEGLILVFADSDFLANENSVQQYNLLGQTMINPINDNLALFLNSIEAFSGNEALIGIRTRAKTQRPFNRLLEIQRKAQEQYQAEEANLSQKLESVQKKLQEINQNQVKDGQIVLTEEQQNAIKQFQTEQIQVKKELRNVRKKLREDIEGLGAILKFINLFTIPLIVFLLGAYIYMKRSNSRKRRVKHA